MNFGRTGVRNLLLSLITICVHASYGALSGIVVDGSGNGIEGASVELLVAGYETTSSANGTFTIDLSVDRIHSVLGKTKSDLSVLSGNDLYFSVTNQEMISIMVFDAAGKCVRNVLSRTLSPDSYCLANVVSNLPKKMYLVRLKIGSESSHFKAVPFTQNGAGPILKRSSNIKTGDILTKTAAIDTFRASKEGYSTAVKAINEYSGYHMLTLTEVLEAADYGIFTEHLDYGVSADDMAIYVWDGATTLNGTHPDAFEGSAAFQVTTGAAGWSGWGWASTSETGANMSAWEGGSIHLAVKGDAPSLGCVVTWDIEGAAQTVDLADYGYLPDFEWYEIEIPFSEFGSIDMSAITYFAAFSAPVTEGGEYQDSSIYFVDDIYWKPAAE